MRSSWIWIGHRANDRKGEDMQRHRKKGCEYGGRNWLRDGSSHGKQEEAGKDPPLEPSGGSTTMQVPCF